MPTNPLLIDSDQSESGDLELMFYGDIIDGAWFLDPTKPDPGYITPDLMSVMLEKAGGKNITLRIHSPGGEVFAASTIRSMLMTYPGHVTCRIDGLCASAATYVATAGERVLMQDSAFMMVHDPWTFAIGNVDELKVSIKMLQEVKKGIVESYQSKTNLEAGQLEKMMADETWMSARTAQEYGFIDEIITAPTSKATADRVRDSAGIMANALRGFDNVPDEVKEQYQDLNVTEEPGSSVQDEAADTEPVLGNPNRAEAVQALRAKIENLKKEEKSYVNF